MMLSSDSVSTASTNPHSTAYGLISYQTAYLKAHYPVQYFAAMLTNEVNDTDKMIKYITECREAGIEILPPDINKSAKAFTIVENKIRFGLSGVKNVGDAAIDSILQVRDEIGEFNSFAHFMSTVDSRKANKKVLESLAKGGCFDSLGLKRSQILHLAREKSDRLTKKENKTVSSRWTCSAHPLKQRLLLKYLIWKNSLTRTS